MPQSFARNPADQFAGNVVPPDLRQLSHAQLLLLRNKLAPNDPLQAELAPLEHAAFAREWTRDNPTLAVPALALAIPAYSAAKASGLTRARTGGNIGEIVEGYRGIARGLVDRFKGRE